MARAKTFEQSLSRSKAAVIEELTRGVETLKKFLAQVEDLGREGFPYLDAARARTESQIRECLRRAFGEKSPEFQKHRDHKLLLANPDDTQRNIALIQSFIVTLEQKKRDLQEGPAPAQIPPAPEAPAPPPAHPTSPMTMTQPMPVMPPPMTMPVAMTTNRVPAAAPTPPSLAPSAASETQELRIPLTPLSEPVPIAPSPSTPTTPQTSTQAANPLVTAPRSQPQPVQAAPSQPITPPQPPRHEPAPAVQQASLVTAPPQKQEQPPLPRPQAQASTPTDTPIQRESAPQPPRSDSNPLELVKRLCHRFHSVARQLRLRGEYRATLNVEDEFDVQDLLHALLRLQFDDIGTDEWTPGYTEGAPRTTFLLDDNRLAVLVKKTRTGLTAKDLTEQLRIDTEHYRAKSRCTTLLCFVYDPEGRIGNPRGLEAALTTVRDSMAIDVLIAPQ